MLFASCMIPLRYDEHLKNYNEKKNNNKKQTRKPKQMLFKHRRCLFLNLSRFLNKNTVFVKTVYIYILNIVFCLKLAEDPFIPSIWC
jgi:hypothetical protein